MLAEERSSIDAQLTKGGETLELVQAALKEARRQTLHGRPHSRVWFSGV